MSKIGWVSTDENYSGRFIFPPINVGKWGKMYLYFFGLQNQAINLACVEAFPVPKHIKQCFLRQYYIPLIISWGPIGNITARCEMKWLNIYRWHFRINLLEWNCTNYAINSTEFPHGSKWQQVSIGQGNDLSPGRSQTPAWINGDLINWRIYASRGLNESILFVEGWMQSDSNVKLFEFA